MRCAKVISPHWHLHPLTTTSPASDPRWLAPTLVRSPLVRGLTGSRLGSSFVQAVTSPLAAATMAAATAGAGRLFIPLSAVRSVRLDRGLAGRVYGRDGIVVVEWLWGEQLLESGLRIAAEADRKAFVKTLQEWVTSGLDRPDALHGGGSS